MSFFDAKQEVIDIELTLFGRGLLARGFFKPVYYRFFDDDVLYNIEYAGVSEEQNTTEDRILETPRAKTQYLTVPVKTRFEHNQNLINTGKVKTFMEIKRRQDPLITDTILKYALQDSNINSQRAPQFHLSLGGTKIRKASQNVTVKGIETPITQLNLTASYTLQKDTRHMINHQSVLNTILDSETYIDLSKDEVVFLDNTSLTVDREDIIIDLQEIGVDLGLDNFEVEIFEVIEGTQGEEQKMIKLENKQEIDKLFNLRVDSQVKGPFPKSLTGKSTPGGRK